MEQRRLRLGDILDDYCPRERRVTNHAVVAMIEEEVKQTRCTTCDAEHAYKGARVPKRRKKEGPDALYREVLAGMPDVEDVAALAEPVPVALVAAPAVAVPYSAPAVLVSVAETAPPVIEDGGASAHAEDDPPADEEFSAEAEPDVVPSADGPVHRPLIRATLPRPEGQKEARPVPDFTVRHSQARGGHGQPFRNGAERMRMRAGNGNGPREVNGNRASSSGGRFAGNRQPGQGRHGGGRSGGASGFRNGNGSQHGKRGRGSRG